MLDLKYFLSWPVARNLHRRPAPARRILLVAPALVVPWLWAQAEPFTEFFRAVDADDAPTVAALIQRGMDANSVNEQGQTALTAALYAGATRVAAVLLASRGIRLDTTNRFGETALMVAALKGNVALMKQLVQAGAEVNRTQWTPLHYAASAGHLEALRYLIEEHAYIDAESANKTTPLMLAARQKHTHAVRWLLDEGADPTLRNQAGMSAADYLDLHKETELADQLRRRAEAFTRRYHRKAPAAEPTQ